MSTARRILTGNIALWVQIIINFVIQMALVPLFLTRWDKETYGLWIAMQSLVGFVQILDTGHQGFLQNEFLRLGIQNRKGLQDTFFAAVIVGFGLALVELAAVIVLILMGQHTLLLGIRSAPAQSKAVAILLIGQSLVWFLSGAFGGTAIRLLVVFGHFTRMAWWGVIMVLTTSIAPILAVLMGQGLLGAGVAQLIAIVAVNVPLIIDIMRPP